MTFKKLVPQKRLLRTRGTQFRQHEHAETFPEILKVRGLKDFFESLSFSSILASSQRFFTGRYGNCLEKN